jgi:hypothetical protein
MTGMKWILSWTVKLLLVAVLGICGSVLVLADDDNQDGGRDKILYMVHRESAS